MKKIVLLFLIVINIVSCNLRDGEKMLPSSNGRFNELMLVINNKVWEGRVGIELKKVIAANVLGLPQPEPKFSITPIAHRGFDGFLKFNRNILSIEKADSPSFTVQYDVYAKPQAFISIQGPDQQSIIKLIKDNAEELVSVYKELDIKSIQKRLGKKTHKINKLTLFKSQGFSIQVPTDFSLIDDTEDFIWFRKRIEHAGYNVSGSLNVIAYTLPLEIQFEQLKDSIVAIRDSIGKKHIPGPSEGSYLITEAAYTPHIFDSSLDGKKAYKVKGKWEVFDNFMAGPFVNYTVYDEKNNRIVVVEGLTYAPLVKKRDFMFELEAIIRTLHIE